MSSNLSKIVWFNIALTIIIGTTLAVVLIIVGADIKERVSRIAIKRSELAVQKIGVQSLPQLKEDFEKARSISALLEKTIPAKAALEQTLISRFQTIAKRSNVKLNAALSETPTEKPAYTTLHLKADGSYANLLAFLRGIETEQFLFGWQSLDLSKNETGGYTAVIITKAFHR